MIPIAARSRLGDADLDAPALDLQTGMSN